MTVNSSFKESSNGFHKSDNGEITEKKDLSQNHSINNDNFHHQEDDEEEEEKLDLSIGIWKFRTNALGTKFANLYVFAICVGLSGLFTSMIHSILHVQLTSLERQFNLNNAKAGLFDTASKIGHMSTILWAGHFAKKVNIPVVVGSAGMFQGIVLMIPALLQFIQPYYLPILTHGHDNSTNDTSYGEDAAYMCDPSVINGTGSKRHTNETIGETNELMFGMILMSQVIKGITDTFHSGFLTTLYMDDNLLDKSKMGIFLGINYVLHDLASPIGKEINGIFSEIPIDLKPTDLDPKDRRFVAAWWMPFLIFGSGMVLFSFPVILFPRRLVTSKQKKDALNKAAVTFAGGHVPQEVVEPISVQGKVDDSIRKPSIVVTGVKSGVPETNKRHYSMKSLQSGRKGSSAVDSEGGRRRSSLYPPIVGPTERKVSMDGRLSFSQPVVKKRQEQPAATRLKKNFIELMRDFPKALMRVAKKPAYMLLLIEGSIMSIPWSGTSLFKSIYMTNEYNVSMAEVALVSGITSAAGHIGGTLVSGWLASKVSKKSHYVMIVLGTALFTIFCSPMYLIFGCGNVPVYGHTGDFGIPVNGSDDCDCASSKQLISCGSDNNNYLSPCYAGCTDVDGKVFKDCTLLQNTTGVIEQTVTTGLCEVDCHTNFLIYVMIHGASSLVSSFANIPRRLLVLRIVDPEDRGFATGLNSFMHSIMGIPSPNLFGSVIDGTCLIWDGDYCSLYDRDKIRYLISGLDIGSHACGQATYLIMFCIFAYETKKLRKKEQAEALAIEAKKNDALAGDMEFNVEEGEEKKEEEEKTKTKF